MDLGTISKEKLALDLHAALIESGKTLALAESCTGGAVSASLTAIADASKFFLGSVVAYSNAWKESFLGVSAGTLKTYGAVSLEVVTEMVEGLFERTNADFAAAVSGIIGPSGGSIDKPVGTVFVAVGKRGEMIDAGLIRVAGTRIYAIDFINKTILAALLRRLNTNKKTFSS
jgi:nicotinamide-nucleotide amidase